MESNKHEIPDVEQNIPQYYYIYSHNYYKESGAYDTIDDALRAYQKEYHEDNPGCYPIPSGIIHDTTHYCCFGNGMILSPFTLAYKKISKMIRVNSIDELGIMKQYKGRTDAEINWDGYVIFRSDWWWNRVKRRDPIKANTSLITFFKTI